VHELVPILDEKGELIKQKKGESTLDCYNRYTIADLSTRDQEVQVAKGGKGGKGSASLIRQHE
jgi:GTPase involved in cell partitioning and DNA repair